MSEALKLLGREDPEYAAGYQECVGCEELERQRAAHMAAWDKANPDSNVNPMAWRLYSVQLMSEARANHERQRQEQIARERR